MSEKNEKGGLCRVVAKHDFEGVYRGTAENPVKGKESFKTTSAVVDVPRPGTALGWP